MPLLDNAISFISPKWSAQRTAWRKIEASYQGGVPTRASESWAREQGYRFGSNGDRQILMNARDRAIEAYDNNPVATTLVDTETDNVIGDGLNYQPASEDKAWNQEAEDKYYEWLEDCSVRGRDIETGCEVQRLAWSSTRVSGDGGWILVARGSDSLIQFVPAQNIVTPDGKFGDVSIYDGIKFDQWGKPLAFHVLTSDERGKRDFAEIPARDFVYLSHPKKPGQARPPSCYITIFELLTQLDRYVDAVALAAWMGAVFGIVFKQNNASKQYGALPTLTNSQGDQQKAITIEKGGLAKYIGTDEEVAQVQAHQPMQQAPDFIRAMYRMLGQPFDMPLEVIAKDMSSCNFASARIGLLPFYRSCRIKAARFGSHWSRTIGWWLSRERLRADGDRKKWKTTFPADFLKHELLVNAWDYTDPVSEAQADLLEIDMGTKSTPMVIKERGRNAEKILRDRLEWQEKTKDLPAINSTMTRHPQTGVGATGDPLGHEQLEPPEPKKEPASPPVDAVKAYARAFRDLIAAENNGDTHE